MVNQQGKSHYHYLKEKWIGHHKSIQENLWSKHKEALSDLLNAQKQLVVGSLSGIMLLTSPYVPALPLPEYLLTEGQKVYADFGENTFLISDLANILPDEVRPLTKDEENIIGEILSERFGIKIAAEIEGKKLNRSYGVIGAEQHLARYPGDNMSTHFDTQDEEVLYWSSGMAPGLGAWGYFTQNGQFTQESNMREKYYVAVQTFLSADFMEKFKEYRDFYKFRKMLVMNPQNGKAVVVVIGDAGPAVWTGKHLGGSPEVMKYLERVDGSRRGPVLYFFIDDPEDKVPLGPIIMEKQITEENKNVPFPVDRNLQVTENSSS